jgi:ATP-dependent DNA ligase
VTLLAMYSPVMPSHNPSGVFGAYLLAVYDPDSETYQTISKLGTGFSEEQLVQLADSLRPSLIPQPRPYYKVNRQLCWSTVLVNCAGQGSTTAQRVPCHSCAAVQVSKSCRQKWL